MQQYDFVKNETKQQVLSFLCKKYNFIALQLFLVTLNCNSKVFTFLIRLKKLNKLFCINKN